MTMRLTATSTLGMYLEDETESAHAERAEGISSDLLYGESAVAFKQFEISSVFASSEVDAFDSAEATTSAPFSSCGSQHFRVRIL